MMESNTDFFTPKPHSHEFRVVAISTITDTLREKMKEFNKGITNAAERWENTSYFLEQSLADLQKECQLSDYTIGTYRRAISGLLPDDPRL